MAEPRVVVASREDLWWLLAEASQLEHMIMCQYLFAEFSLKSGTDDGLTTEQAAAVERWREIIRGIAIEEMLHLALVSNLMAAIGAAPTFTRPNFPQRSGYFPTNVQLDLLPFGDPALRHFLFLERPEGMERQDADEFKPVAPPREPLSPDEVMPRGQEFLTVGHLYRGVEEGIRGLAARLGERAAFIGSPRAQATPALFGGWPQVIAVTDLTSAQKAVDEIIEQGEGARATGDRRTMADSSGSGTSIRRCGNAIHPSSRPATSFALIRVSHLTFLSRKRSSAIPRPIASPSLHAFHKRWSCSCSPGSSRTPMRRTGNWVPSSTAQ